MNHTNKLATRYPKLGDQDLTIHTGPPNFRLFLHFLERIAEEDHVQLIIIDTLFKCLSVTNINDYVEVGQVLQQVRDIAITNNIHILGIHHDAKSGAALLGSYRLAS